MTRSDPLVSIVIPCYNQGTYLQQAIESVLSQDYSRIELMVFDDGSTDDTQTVLAAYAGKFHYETHANMGQARTLNQRLGHVQGPVSFVSRSRRLSSARGRQDVGREPHRGPQDRSHLL